MRSSIAWLLGYLILGEVRYVGDAKPPGFRVCPYNCELLRQQALAFRLSTSHCSALFFRRRRGRGRWRTTVGSIGSR